MRRVRYLAVAVLLLAAMLPGATVASAASPYTCTGGAIPPGTYSSLTVAGTCAIPSGMVTVLGDVTVMPGASLNAAVDDASAGIPSGDLVVSGDMFVGQNAILLLGCAPSLECTSPTQSKIAGSLRADRPLAMILHGNAIGGHVSVTGGGGGLSCDPNAAVSGALGLPPVLPAYSTFEGNKITGGVSVSQMESCWFGFIRNEVSGAVSFQNNKMLDPDAMEFVTNDIRGSLKCSGNSPAPQVGDSGGAPNEVTGAKLGQCKMIQ